MSGLISIAIATLALYGIVGGSQTTYAEEQNSTSGQVTGVSAPTEGCKDRKSIYYYIINGNRKLLQLVVFKE